MKLRFLPIAALLLLAACSDTPRNTDNSNSELRNSGYDVASTDSNMTAAPAPFTDEVTRCYLYAKGGDTISMKVSQTGQTINGDLQFHFSEKDNSDGYIQGEMQKDTLVADYTFKAEGSVSVRQVVFLKRGDGFVMGSGEVQNAGNKEFFKDLSKAKFDNIVLQRVDCTQ
jgi:hypothetical protein